MKFYHVAIYYEGETYTFEPRVPRFLQKGEDKKTPRVCVTRNWKHSLRSIIVLKRLQRAYIYFSELDPVAPHERREELIKAKKIRKNCNDFRLPPDGVVNDEHWYTEPVKMKFAGMVEVPKDDYARMLMGMGMFNDPDVEKYKLKPYKNRNDSGRNDGR